jgi:hypothetical protein
MFNFIKNLFSNTPKYHLGALESPQDHRNIALATFQSPVQLPNYYETKMPPVEDQGGKGKCVGCAIHKVAELYLSQEGQPFIDLSDDDLYDQCKLEDGIPEVSGTYPTVGARVATKNGIATVQAYQTKDPTIIKKSREQNKLSGYAFVSSDYIAICQAIYQNKAVTASVTVDNNWFMGKIMRVLQSIGRHYIVLNGFNLLENKLMGQNSWSVRWIGYVAGIADSRVQQGCFEMAWEDYKDTMIDIIVFTYIPPKILEEVKTKEYLFTRNLSLGMQGYEVTKLQERLKREGCYDYAITGFFGAITKGAVQKYQAKHGISTVGIVGPSTRKSLNGPMTLVQAIAMVETNNINGVIGDHHLSDKAYGILQIRQPCVDDVNKYLKTNYKSQDCLNNIELSLKIFDAYQNIYNPKGKDEEKARTWNGGSGWKQKPYLTDGYWQKVKAYL